MGTGRIRRVKCGFVRKARKGSQAREGEGGNGNSPSSHVSLACPLASASSLGTRSRIGRRNFFAVVYVCEVECQCHILRERTAGKGRPVLGPLT